MAELVVLGDEAQDMITGFKGTATSRVDHISGCSHVFLQPPVKDDGVIPQARGFDESRLKITKKQRVKISPEVRGLLSGASTAIALGGEVEDTISGFKGIAIARCISIAGHEALDVQPPVDKEGKVPDAQYIDNNRLKKIGKGVVLQKSEVQKKPGGPAGSEPRARR